MENIREFFGIQLRRGFTPMISALQRLKVTPNQITIAGTVLNVAAAALVVTDHLIYAGIVFLVAGCFDMLDGALARLAQERAPPSGPSSIRRSTGSRKASCSPASPTCWRSRGARSTRLWWCWPCWAASLVSYTRARAESLGVECKVGLMSRPERIILIALGLFFDVLSYVIYIMLALTVFTVIQRVVHTYRQLQAKGTGRIR